MYNLDKATTYWNEERLNAASTFTEAVAGFGRPSYINDAYTQWEINVIEKILNNRPHPIILDMACGIGRFTVPVALKTGTKKIYACDISSNMLNICKINIANLDLLKKVEFICSDSTSITLPKASLDAVICLGLLEHLPQNWQFKTLEKINNLLKLGGRLILEINNSESIFLKNNEDNNYRSAYQHSNGYFCNLIDTDKIKNKLSQLGMKITNEYSNPFFSLISHLLREISFNNGKIEDEIGSKWMKTGIFLEELSISDIPKAISDQYILEIVKQQ